MKIEQIYNEMIDNTTKAINKVNGSTKKHNILDTLKVNKWLIIGIIWVWLLVLIECVRGV